MARLCQLPTTIRREVLMRTAPDIANDRLDLVVFHG